MVRQAGYALAAGGLGLVIAWRLADGSARSLVQGWYVPILAGTAAVLLLLAAAALAPVLRRPLVSRPRPTAAGAAAAAVIGLPILLSAAFEPRPLASGSLDLSAAASRQFSPAAGSADPASRNVYQWAYEFATAEPAAIAGLPVDVVGFVYRPDSEPADRFRVARFVVACCIADAQGFTLPVLWKDASTLANDQWVRVTGRVGIGPDGAPLVLAASVEPVEAPRNPYLYP